MERFNNLHVSIKLIIASILAGLVAVAQKPEFATLLPAWIQPLWSTFINTALVGGGAYAAYSPLKNKEDAPK